MSQSLFQVYLHVVFSTKKRRAYLQDFDLRHRLFAYLFSACKGQGYLPIIVNGYVDHAHLLLGMGKTILPPDLIGEIKEDSSKWVKEQGLERFYWQPGYGCFSVSASHVPAVKKYIADQEQHHAHEDFETEYLRLLEKNGVAYDERYLWD
ncbi:MAG: transposase [Acidobacteria bacterium]|nr:transposase [Acidobacteriota bacterium]MCB9399068.1 transposase [Acidobacteriota bacterium]